MTGIDRAGIWTHTCHNPAPMVLLMWFPNLVEVKSQSFRQGNGKGVNGMGWKGFTLMNSGCLVFRTDMWSFLKSGLSALALLTFWGE